MTPSVSTRILILQLGRAEFQLLLPSTYCPDKWPYLRSLPENKSFSKKKQIQLGRIIDCQCVIRVGVSNNTTTKPVIVIQELAT